MLAVHPYCHKEIASILDLFEWMLELGGAKNHKCLLVQGFMVSDAVAAKVKRKAEDVYEEVTCIRAPREDERPWPANANIMFQSALWHIALRMKCPWFWHETDMIPLKPGWLNLWEAEYATCGKPFMGYVVTLPDGSKHLTGCAVYPPEPYDYTPNLTLCDYPAAFDVAGGAAVVAHTHATKLFQHRWFYNTGEHGRTYSADACHFGSQSDLSILEPEACVFHRCKDGSLIARLREESRLGTPSGVECEPSAPAEVPAAVPDPEPVAKTPRKTKRFWPRPKQQPSVTWFIKSFHRDIPFLHYCLRGIKKFSMGFNQPVLAVPAEEIGMFQWAYPEYGVRLVPVQEPAGDGYLAQQVIKMRADEICEGSDYIAYIDSDCVLTEEVYPSDLFRAKKPLLLCRPWEAADKAIFWKESTDQVLGWETQMETMCRHPSVYPSKLLKPVRDHIEKRHNAEFAGYMMSLPRFSEFNICGNYFLKHHRDEFEVRDTTKDKVPDPVLVQFWSGNGVTDEIKQQAEQILA